MSSLTMPNGHAVCLERPVIMGILNVTPDSFSDGGNWGDPGEAVRHALDMADQGAQIIDVGGESTRPGSQPVAAEEQMRRVLPVIERIARSRSDLAISIDTSIASVAAAALEAGASILNDVSAGRSDPGMFELAAATAAPLILMHMQGTPRTMQQEPAYVDVVAQVKQFLCRRVDAAIVAGVRSDQIIVDPGIGFGKASWHNLALLANLHRIVADGLPVLLGTSRKRFMGELCRVADNTTPRPAELVEATCATTALGVAAGVAVFRVHDVKANRQAADVAWAILQARS